MSHMKVVSSQVWYIPLFRWKLPLFSFAFGYWKIMIIFPTSGSLRRILQNTSSKTFWKHNLLFSNITIMKWIHKIQCWKHLNPTTHHGTRSIELLAMPEHYTNAIYKLTYHGNHRWRWELLQLYDRWIFSTRKKLCLCHKRTTHSPKAKYLAWYSRGHNYWPISLSFQSQ